MALLLLDSGRVRDRAWPSIMRRDMVVRIIEWEMVVAQWNDGSLEV